MINPKGDFTAEVRLLWVSALAVIIGSICAYVAVALLWLIRVFTNLFYFQQFSSALHLPAEGVAALGLWSILVPVIGGLIIGLMARYGSERIRGHGIPEAIEAILIGRSRMQARVAVLKPISSAISIGSGGPFGAEGPIIMTGGAFGSLIAQLFNMTAAERKTLLVAGAAGGMAATFSTPVAAVLLAVELLLFEWKPRSMIPVALASATAALLRPFLLEPGPLFGITPHATLGLPALLSCVGVGLLGGLLALALTVAVYAFEDLFHRVPIHWMWWPAIGGVAVGVGGYFQPRALGVGYDLIHDLLHGNYIVGMLIPLIVVKCLIWSCALGSGTSGGVLAPLLIMGGALGAIESSFLPGGDRSLWPLVSMAAVMGGTMRSPLTGAVFALELTNDIRALPALLIASVVSYGFTVLVMRRSILTEKVARRGYHVSREYSVDPLELINVSDVMSTNLIAIPAATPVREVLTRYFLSTGRKHQGYPVVDRAGLPLGVITRTSVLEDWVAAVLGGPGGPAVLATDPIIAYDLIQRDPITAFPWESCRTAAERMAKEGVGRLLVVAPDDGRKLVGILTRSDLLKSRARLVEEEMKREGYLARKAATG